MCLKIFVGAIVLLFLAQNANSANENGENLTLSNGEMKLVRQISDEVSKLSKKGIPKDQRGNFKKQIDKIKEQLGSGKSWGRVRAKFVTKKGQKSDSNANVVPKQLLADLQELLVNVRNALKASYNDQENYDKVFNEKLKEMKKCERDLIIKRKRGGKALLNLTKTNSKVVASGEEEGKTVRMSPAVSDVKDEYVKLATSMSMLPCKNGKRCKKGAKKGSDDEEEGEGVQGKNSGFVEGCIAALCCCWILEECF